MDNIFLKGKEEILLVKGEYDLEGTILDKSSKLYRDIKEQLEYDFHKKAIKLNQCSKNLVGKGAEPNILFISKNQGGFSRKGIKIVHKDSEEFYTDVNFVDLALDEENVAQGELKIFTHELGHVMMDNILQDILKYSKASKQHCSIGITDYFMAFFEGWGEHFERMAYENIGKYKDMVEKEYGYDKDIINLWHCNRDEEFRREGVLKNKYIYRKIPIDMRKEKISTREAILREHISFDYDSTKILTAGEMMACEGVLATLFYRINTSKVIQHNGIKKEILDRFLIEPVKENDIEYDFHGIELAVLKNFWVWTLMKDNINDNMVPFIEYIKIWMEEFKEDKDEILNIFLSTTIGTTVTNDLKEIYEEASKQGAMGNIDKFIPLVKHYREEYKKVFEKIKNENIALDEMIPKEVWVKSKNMKIPSIIWEKESGVPLMVNMNTASINELMTIENMRMETAEKILAERNRGIYKINSCVK